MMILIVGTVVSIAVVSIVIIGAFAVLSCEYEQFADEPLHYQPTAKKEGKK